METLGFAREEARTQMADVMKQMNKASDQSTITPTKDCLNFPGHSRRRSGLKSNQ